MRSHAALALLVVGAAVSLVWLVHPWYDATNDGSMYIATTRALLHGEGYTYLGEPFRMRPPGFFVMLAPVLALFGTSFIALNLYIALFGVACIALLFVHAQRRVGVHVALVLCAVVWVSPGFRMLCSQVLSDVPGAALMLAVLLLEPWARRRPLSWRDAALGILIAAATYVRSINGLLVPAILLGRLLVRRPPDRGGVPLLRRAVSQGALLVIVPLVLLLPWALRASSLPEGPPAEQTYHYSYSIAMWHEDSRDPSSPRLSAGDILARIPGNLTEVAGVVGSRLDRDRRNLVPGVLALACWAVVLVRRREPAEILVALMLGVLAVYFAFVPRLALPVYLLVAPAVVEVVFSLLRRFLSPRRAETAVIVMLVALGAADFSPRHAWPEIEAEHAELKDVADHVAATYPEANLGASIGWDLAVHLDRPVHSLQIAVHRDGMDGVDRIIAREGIDVVMVNRRSGGGRKLHRQLTGIHGIALSLPGADIVEIERPESPAP